MTDRRGPEPIKGVLDAVLKNIGVARPVEVAHLVSQWEDIAGEPFAGRSRPVRLDDGCLLVEVDDGTSASLLKYRIGELKSRLEARLGRGLVTDVRLKVARPGKPR